MPALLHSSVFILSLLSLLLAVLHIVKQATFPLWPAVLLASLALMVAAFPVT